MSIAYLPVPCYNMYNAVSEVCWLRHIITLCLNTVHRYYYIFTFVSKTNCFIMPKSSITWLFAMKDVSE